MRRQTIEENEQGTLASNSKKDNQMAHKHKKKCSY